jgi:PAS domain-containing protein
MYNKVSTIIKYISQMKQTLTFDEKLTIMVNLGKELIDADRCSIWSYDLSTNKFITKFAHGIDGELNIACTDGIIGHCFITKETILIDDAHNNEFFNSLIEEETGYITKSMITIPIFNTKEEVIGIFQALNKLTKDQKFTKRDVELLEVVRVYMGEVFESTALYNELESRVEEEVEKNRLKDQEYIKELSINTKELEEYKRVLSESDIVSKADLKGNITYANKKFEEISGYTNEELLGKPHNILRHPDVPKELFKKMWDTIQSKKNI